VLLAMSLQFTAMSARQRALLVIAALIVASFIFVAARRYLKAK
jgi:hypothetical protein